MIFFPNAKINIGLRITGKRPDGFHDLETVFYPVMLSDALEFVISDNSAGKDSITVTGIETGSEPENNLVIKAVNRLRAIAAFPVLNIHLHKGIPVGAGLGGGSSDATCMLKVLNRHFELNLDHGVLMDIALELGSDCPFFIECVPAYATGRGEILTPVKPVLAGYYLVLVNPGIGINTGAAFRNCSPALPSTSLTDLIQSPPEEWKSTIINDFEAYAIKEYPIIGYLKEELYRSDALFSLMSGSGSSVYGIFRSKPELSTEIRKFVIWEGIL
jgi:4-diphosphocytidyl-2-C-methyl-D-erythritol kinase